MKQHILPAIRLTLVCIIFFCGLYSLLILAIAQVAPAHGEGETISVNDKIVGYKLLSQKFTEDKYFDDRPSASDYNATASGGSNKGPSDPGYLKILQTRVDTFLVHNPGVDKEEIPSDLITESGSGLDPDISIQGAYIQVKRIAKIRNISEEKLSVLVDKHIEKPLFGFLGPEKVNVLQLNIDLDALK
ncbi:MAG TPA: K(+)-transporting ATPase subunit C [Hanamia sp.]|nr:K(+)-transporting ATPase subunit C [Hanamia sp.]